jgi:hypothetical protein
LPRQRFGQAGKSIGAKLYRAEPAGEPLTQAGDRLLERSLRAQRGTAQEPRFHDEAKSLLGG